MRKETKSSKAIDFYATDVHHAVSTDESIRPDGGSQSEPTIVTFAALPCGRHMCKGGRELASTKHLLLEVLCLWDLICLVE